MKQILDERGIKNENKKRQNDKTKFLYKFLGPSAKTILLRARELAKVAHF